jgi:hypothetical protein
MNYFKLHIRTYEHLLENPLDLDGLSNISCLPFDFIFISVDVKYLCCGDATHNKQYLIHIVCNYFYKLQIANC